METATLVAGQVVTWDLDSPEFREAMRNDNDHDHAIDALAKAVEDALEGLDNKFGCARPRSGGQSGINDPEPGPGRPLVQDAGRGAAGPARRGVSESDSSRCKLGFLVSAGAAA